MIKINKYFVLLITLLFIVSCDTFLDEAPDNRTQVDSSDKIRKLLASAYSGDGFAIVAELSSDNVVDEGEQNPNNEPIYQEMAYWKDITLAGNDDTKGIWESHYSAIAHSNTALEAIEKSENKEKLKAEKAEALISRAYAHFVLVNIFAKHYNENTGSTDLGVPYIEESEKTLNPKYKRATVKEVYEKINRDIEAALPYIDDNIYEQPRYHFNLKAAYAFAARFNLYYEKWEKAKKYASKVLETSQLINWKALGELTSSLNFRSRELIKDEGVFLLQTDVSNAGLLFGAYYHGARINHTRFVANKETVLTRTPLGAMSVFSPYSRLFAYNARNYTKVNSPKIPYMFEYTDHVARIGYRRSVYPLFTSDESMLIRAEANIMLKNYAEAMADLNSWTKNYYRGRQTTIDAVNTFYNAMEYSGNTADKITQKKKLNPAFPIADVQQENMLHYLLQSRRVLTLHEGLRWFDVKRYGIEVKRFFKDISDNYVLKETLTKDDNRRAIQIPSDVISSGITPNPR